MSGLPVTVDPVERLGAAAVVAADGPGERPWSGGASAGCPGECFASPFLLNYVKLFDLYVDVKERFNKLENRYQKLDRYVTALEESDVANSGGRD